MKLKVLILNIMIVLLGTTTYSMAESSVPIEASTVVEEDTWFGDAYEEDGCYCN